MLPKYHTLINFLISLPLLLFLNPLYVAIFFLSSFMIDIDHYIYYVFEKKSINPVKSYRWFRFKDSKWKKLSTEERRKHSNTILFLHGIEPLLVILLLSRTYPLLFFVVLGFIVHLLEDMVEEVKLGVAERKIFLLYSVYVFLTKEDFTKTIPDVPDLIKNT